MVRNRSLKKIAVVYDLDDCAYLRSGQKVDDLKSHQIASILEALIGAVFVDSGQDLDKVDSVMTLLGLECPSHARCPKEMDLTLIHATMQEQGFDPSDVRMVQDGPHIMIGSRVLPLPPDRFQ